MAAATRRAEEETEALVREAAPLVNMIDVVQKRNRVPCRCEDEAGFRPRHGGDWPDAECGICEVGMGVVKAMLICTDCTMAVCMKCNTIFRGQPVVREEPDG